jgi:hypothetical protein
MSCPRTSHVVGVREGTAFRVQTCRATRVCPRRLLASGGLHISHGAIIGIAVGASALTVVALVPVVLALKRRRRRLAKAYVQGHSMGAVSCTSKAKYVTLTVTNTCCAACPSPLHNPLHPVLLLLLPTLCARSTSPRGYQVSSTPYLLCLHSCTQ